MTTQIHQTEKQDGGDTAPEHVAMRILWILALCLAGCTSGRDWDMFSKQDFPSPDGQRIATVFEMCGYNTTGYEPQASLLKPGQKPGEFGNLLRGGLGDIFKAQWTSSSNLVVEYRPGGEWVTYPPESTNMDGATVEFRKR